MRTWLLAALCACGGSAAPAPAPAVATADAGWATRPGWASETIPFPLGFAPDIELRGVELLRFAPAFYDRAQPGYFTYAFVWLVAAPSAPIDAPWLSLQLQRYYDGLCRATAGEEAAGCERHRTHVELVATQPRAFALASTRAWQVTLAIFDGFEANQPVTLTGVLEVGSCGSQVVVGAALSPAGGLEAALRQAEAFACPAP